jgi:hypothetical protein
MRATRRFSADEDQLGRVSWVARRIGHGDLTAKRGSQDGWALDAKHIAESTHVVAPLSERPRLLWPSIAAAVAAVVQVDDLGAVGQARVRRLVN